MIANTEMHANQSATQTSFLKIALERRRCSSEIIDVANIQDIRTLNITSVAPMVVQRCGETDFTTTLFNNRILDDMNADAIANSIHVTPDEIGCYSCIYCGKNEFNTFLDLKHHHNFTCLRSIFMKYSHENSNMIEQDDDSVVHQAMTAVCCDDQSDTIYKCSLCGIYCESWNIYIHILEYHGRHVCLYCSNLYSSAEKLALHLEIRHDMEQNHYNSEYMFRFSNNCREIRLDTFTAQYYQLPGRILSANFEMDGLQNSDDNVNTCDFNECFLICCTCQHIFQEEDTFSKHDCGDYIKQCPLCGQKIYGKQRHFCDTTNQTMKEQKKLSTLNKLPAIRNIDPNSIQMREATDITVQW